MSALMWWLIPLAVVAIAVGIVALVSYLRRPTEDHDLGQFASLQAAMSRTQTHDRRTSGSSSAERHRRGSAPQ